MSGFVTRRKALSIARNYVVAPVGGDFTTLSGALAAITTASASEQYQITVVGQIAETDTVTAKSYVHVTGLAGATVTVTKNGTGNGFVFNNLVDTCWRGLKLIRAGAVAAASIVAVQIIGTCDNTVRLENCHIENNNTGTGGYGHGLILGAGVSVTS
ncbi:MAG: hypothetical protein WC718_14865, partial [Phycisphaerales bacterium]